MNAVVIASAVRTPLGAFGGQLAGLSEQQLAAAAMQEAVRRAGLPAAEIDEVIVGIAKQTSRPSNGARHAMLLARLPENLPAYTVQRQSASGLQAVVSGYWAIRCGDAGVILAGGTESMSQIPFEIRNARYAFDEKRRRIIDAIPAQESGAQPEALYGRVTTEQVAENLARKYQLPAEELAAFAESSLRKARESRERGGCEDEIFPLAVVKGKKEVLVRADELPDRAQLLAAPADGAAMCILAGRERAEALNLPVLAEIVSVGIAASDPRFTGSAVVEAGRRALSKAASRWTMWRSSNSTRCPPPSVWPFSGSGRAGWLLPGLLRSGSIRQAAPWPRGTPGGPWGRCSLPGPCIRSAAGAPGSRWSRSAPRGARGWPWS